MLRRLEHALQCCQRSQVISAGYPGMNDELSHLNIQGEARAICAVPCTFSLQHTPMSGAQYKVLSLCQ